MILLHDIIGVAGEEEVGEEGEEGGHQHENRRVEGHGAGQVPREGIVTPLNDRYLALLVEEGQAVAHIIDDEAENSQALRHAELVAIRRLSAPANAFFLALEHDTIVGFKHDEL